MPSPHRPRDVEIRFTPSEETYRRLSYRKRYPRKGGHPRRPPEDAVTIVLRPVPEIDHGCSLKGRMRGKTQDVFGLQEFTALMLWNNEFLPPHQKLTDETMIRVLWEEFPKSKLVQQMVAGTKKLNVLRSYYNHGDMTGGVKPSVRSYRYTSRGERANLRTGKALRINNGRVLDRKRGMYKPEGGRLDARIAYGPAVDGAYDGSEGWEDHQPQES